MFQHILIEKSFRKAFIILTLSELAAAIGPLIDGVITAAFYGADGVRQFGLVNPMAIAYCVLGSVFAVGSVTLCSRLIGKGNSDEARGAFSVAFLWVLGLSVLFAIVLLLLATPMTGLLGADPAQTAFFTETRNYYIGLTIGFPATNLLLLLNAFMQVDNDTGRTLAATIILTAVDIAGDLLNVQVIRGGMLGMGLATSIANYLGLIVVLLHFAKKNVFFKPRFSKLPWRLTRQMLATGSTAFAMLIGNTAALIILNRVLVRIGDAAGLVAFTAMRSVYAITTTVVKGLGRCVMTMGGFFYGERNKTELRNLFLLVVKYTIIAACGAAILTALLAGPLASLFIGRGNQAMLPEAALAVRWLALCLPFMAFNVGYESFFRGAGRLKPSLLMTILRDFALPAASGCLLSAVLQARGVYVSFAAAQILLFAGLIILFMIEGRKKDKPWISGILLLPENFEIPEEKYLSAQFTNTEECVEASRSIEDLCRMHGIPSKHAMYAALCMEEMGMNILKHGFEKKKGQQISMFAYIDDDKKINLSIRDNCRPFSPVEWEEIHRGDEDRFHNIGIRMVGRISEEMRYVDLMEMNSLYIKI